MAEDIVYLAPGDVFAIHEDIIEDDPESEQGLHTPDAVDSALTYVSEEYFGESPGTIHEKAAHLMRLLVADHPFVDGNKRTALNTVVVFYDVNGYEFEYDDDRIRGILRAFATKAATVEMAAVVAYFRRCARPAKE